MEQRLIDANALIKAMCSNCALFLDKTCDGNRISCYPSSIVREQPTVDAVPVVRCRECKHSIGEKVWLDGEVTIYCANGMGYPPPNWFCADGERKEINNG